MSTLLNIFQGQDFWSILTTVLDISLVAFFLYRILLLIRGTRAAYMLTGLLILAVIFFAANQLSLTTVGWLLDHLINYILIIVIIVFQADIRGGLSRMGREMFASTRTNEDISVIDEVVQSCETMAKNHVGALIVFEREVDLAEFIDQGTVLEARVSKALLGNIFTPLPDNPLHDGAVIIKGKWLDQAGAILPLSRSPSMDKALGTRHRAGVGITEESDAISIIVSEQRGSISLCKSGVLHMGLNPPTLRRELLALLALDDSRQWNWLSRLLGRWESAIGGGSGHAPLPTENRSAHTTARYKTLPTEPSVKSREEANQNTRTP